MIQGSPKPTGRKHLKTETAARGVARRWWEKKRYMFSAAVAMAVLFIVAVVASDGTNRGTPSKVYIGSTISLPSSFVPGARQVS
jgi:hypothetical protein